MEYKFITMRAAARTFVIAAFTVAALPNCYSQPNVSSSDITHTSDPNVLGSDPNGTDASDGSGLTIQPSVDGGKCLQVQTVTGSTASSVGLGTCTGTAAQRWVYANGQLQSVQSKQCLDVTGNEPADANATMTVATCNTARTSQAWIVDRGILYVDNGNTQSSLALGTNPPTDGSAVKLGAVNFNDAAQKWTLNVTPPNTTGQSSDGFHITPASTPTACLDVNGTNLVTNPCSDANSQQWTWLVTGLLQSAGSKNCISLPANPNAGTQPNLVACDAGVVPELWISTGGEFVNNSLSKCADATGGSAANGAVLVNDCNGGSSQQWSFGGSGTAP